LEWCPEPPASAPAPVDPVGGVPVPVGLDLKVPLMHCHSLKMKNY